DIGRVSMRGARCAMSQRRRSTSECRGRNAGGKATMTYDVTIITVRPGTHPDALLRLQQQASEVAPAGELFACWDSELGGLNQILLIRSCGEEDRLVAQRPAMLQSQKPFGLSDFIIGMPLDMSFSFPFLPPI